MYKKSLFFLLVFFSTFKLFATDIDFEGKNLLIGKYLDILVDTNSNYQFKDVEKNQNFYKSNVETPNFGVSKFTYWLRFTVSNQTKKEDLFIEIEYPMLQSAILYSSDPSDPPQEIYEYNHFDQRTVKHQNFVYRINIKNGQTKTYYLKIKGDEQIVLPLLISTPQGFLESSLTKEIITGISVGILLVMILYNLFVYFSIKDKSYLYYVLYILFIGLTQAAITGYTFKYLWPNAPYFNHLSIILFPALAGSFALIFVRHFLHTNEKLPLLNKLINIIIVVYGFAVLTRIIGWDQVSYRMIDFTGLIGSVTVLVIAIKLTLKNFKPAKFFLIAWVVFITGIVVFVLRNLNILPYNIFTNYTMQAGTSIEVILLSFALADKINILTTEKEVSQMQALQVSLENQKIIKEQNVVLEERVKERTTELTYANVELNNTLTTLKNTQTQLVDAEKMASLGQLTAGIAHEINNPINFVSSNISPLKRDIKDLWDIIEKYDQIKDSTSYEEVTTVMKEVDALKKEIDIDYLRTELKMLLDGMQDGAQRTVEIVKGLKIFSRVDEADLKYANINDGIKSTLIILNNQLNGTVKVIKDLGNLPDIECFAGKLNQVFMNILSNAIFAVQNNSTDRPPTIWVKTFMPEKETVRISIKDNGSGMPPEVKTKIFEPFFTTKSVGQGTGLGLSIVYQIVGMHNGNMEVISGINEGTEFILDLPIHHQSQKN